MNNKLDISKILMSIRCVLSTLRVNPTVLNFTTLMNESILFFDQDIDTWQFNEFLKLFSQNAPNDNYDDYREEILCSINNAKPTDNTKLISQFRTVFKRLFAHALLLNSENKIEQLKDFLDSIHCLSEALIVNKKWHSRDFWNVYIKPYCKRWNVQFPGMRKYFFRFFIFNRR